MLAHHGAEQQGGQMKQDYDQFLMIRAQLRELVDTLRMTSYDANPVQFLMRLEHIRELARRSGLGAIAEITATFEAALQRTAQRGRCEMVTDSFFGILEDAIGVAHLHPSASEALLASVAIRLGG
ncbi:MAG: hypothetical protein WB821_01345 [Burkholderiaceae bacterium]